MNIRKCISRLTIGAGLVLTSAWSLLGESAEKTAEHANESRRVLGKFLGNPNFSTKYYVMLLLGLIVVVILLRKKMNQRKLTVILLISFLLFGLAGNIPIFPFNLFGMHPSPICVTKAMLYGFAIPMIVMLAVILILSLIGPRIYCGYICPVGALQELIRILGDRLKIRRIPFSFVLSQVFRIGLFIAFIFLSVTSIIHVVFKDRVFAVSLYDYINAFHGLEIGRPGSLVEGLTQYLPLFLTAVLAFKFYRPFCHFVCPIGLFTNWAEPVALFRVGVDRKSCSDCNKCLKESPCRAIDDILHQSTTWPDCFMCNRCIEVCPEKTVAVRPIRFTDHHQKLTRR